MYWSVDVPPGSHALAAAQGRRLSSPRSLTCAAAKGPHEASCLLPRRKGGEHCCCEPVAGEGGAAAAAWPRSEGRGMEATPGLGADKDEQEGCEPGSKGC